MGNACGSARYELLVENETEVVQERLAQFLEVELSALQPDITFMRDVNVLLRRAGLVIWLSVLPLYLAGMALSSCDDGAPLWLYLAPFGIIAFTRHTELSIVQIFADQADTGFLPQKHVRDAVLESTPSELLKVLDSRWMMMVFGALSILDLSTDAMQPGQVRRCEESAQFEAQYLESWQTVWKMGEAVAVTHMWGLFSLLLVVVILVQGLFGWRKLLAAQGHLDEEGQFCRMGRYDFYTQDEMQELSSCTQSFPANIGDPRNTHLLVSFGYSRYSEYWSNLAMVADWAGMLHLAKFLKLLAGRAARRGSEINWEGWKPGKPESEEGGNVVEKNDQGEEVFRVVFAVRDAEEVAKFKAAFQQILRCVLMENAPSMFVTTAFFCLRFDSLTMLGIVKLSFSAALSVTGALAKAKESSKGGCKGLVVGLLIVLLVLLAGVKWAYAFVCPSHFFSLLTMQCVQRISKA